MYAVTAQVGSFQSFEYENAYLGIYSLDMVKNHDFNTIILFEGSEEDCDFYLFACQSQESLDPNINFDEN